MKKIGIVGYNGITTVTEKLVSDKLTMADEENVYEITQMGEYPHMNNPVQQYFRDKAKIGRNEPCPCGSDKKYKKCCINEK
tara:strand:+ start:4017 stop:4259 length:243 start_codon:yes stop_codon:yes gene_type:complete